jgi:integrase
MALTFSLLRGEIGRTHTPGEALQNVNCHLLDMNEADMFVTLLCGILDLTTREFSYVRAGHQLPLVLDGSGRDIELPHVLSVLEPIWREKTETASRLRGRMESVLDWATARGYRSGPNPARWKGHLDKLLPAPGRIAKTDHHRSLPYEDMPTFFAQLHLQEGSGARALEFVILTAGRSGEVRGATWDEFDLNAGKWVIPASRMKAKKEHRVALSAQAVALLKAQKELRVSEIVFPSPRDGVMVSDMTLSAVLRRMKVDAVPHGFRSTFRNWAAETTNYPREIAELALAHVVGSEVERAYMRSDLFEKRRALMQDWADFVSGISAKG